MIIVGGDLDRPTADEQSTIERVSSTARGAAPGAVVVAGHLPPAGAYELMADAAAHEGTYVCASEKEEFALATVQALVAGAPVVAALLGGEPGYIDDGSTGIRCDTQSVDDLRAAIRRALALVSDWARAYLQLTPVVAGR